MWLALFVFSVYLGFVARVYSSTTIHFGWVVREGQSLLWGLSGGFFLFPVFFHTFYRAFCFYLCVPWDGDWFCPLGSFWCSITLVEAGFYVLLFFSFTGGVGSFREGF